MTVALLLGPVLFESFELPERISFGGRQRMTVHVLPGGERVIDAMGREDAQVCWTGVFSGGEAAARARLLDGLRGDGGVWPLTWEAFFYSVVVAEFRADFTRTNWIPYRIACTVLRDEVAAGIDAAVSLLGEVTPALALAGGALVEELQVTTPSDAPGLLAAGDAAAALAQSSLSRGYQRRAAANLSLAET